MINLTPSQSEYLKTIYLISLKGKIQVTKIADSLNYSKPSVIRALKNLHELKLINYNNKDITITEIGSKFARNILRKDDILQKFLIDVLKVDSELAKKDVENMKYSVSCCTISKLEKFLEEMFEGKISNYQEYCLNSDNNQVCSSCK